MVMCGYSIDNGPSFIGEPSYLPLNELDVGKACVMKDPTYCEMETEDRVKLEAEAMIWLNAWRDTNKLNKMLKRDKKVHGIKE